MTVNLQAFRAALQLSGIQANEEIVFLIGHIYEEVKEKGTKVTLEDILRVKEMAKQSLNAA